MKSQRAVDEYDDTEPLSPPYNASIMDAQVAAKVKPKRRTLFGVLEGWWDLAKAVNIMHYGKEYVFWMSQTRFYVHASTRKRAGALSLPPALGLIVGADSAEVTVLPGLDVDDDSVEPELQRHENQIPSANPPYSFSDAAGFSLNRNLHVLRARERVFILKYLAHDSDGDLWARELPLGYERSVAWLVTGTLDIFHPGLERVSARGHAHALEVIWPGIEVWAVRRHDPKERHVTVNRRCIRGETCRRRRVGETVVHVVPPVLHDCVEAEGACCRPQSDG
ncbi:hypothetical protein O1611_g8509 [Lasiodiplodia mahajangana]|uniref:Uncharacterized protein n=1 Tax=Lasiodiplodia mahajangana TaxID=1108764 RepID=A0ACC2JCL9_9PEZI|nr:hypothetical protein O1611_g8509 [Lasiodiplodia mahajangana]